MLRPPHLTSPLPIDILSPNMIASSSRKVAAAALVSSLVSSVSAASWDQTLAVRGNDFFNFFDWFTERDPTNGLVNYVSQEDAQAQNLSFVDADNHFVMAVSTVKTALSGRNSVRVSSKESFSDGVYVLNVTHVPTGCATWPAFWTVTDNLKQWPVGGEIDIMENANDQYKANLASIHTNSSCTIPATTAELGTVATTNCSAFQPANPGCRIEMNGTSTPTWGSALNRAGGGLIAMERSFGTTGKGVRVWYFPNSDPSSIPSDLKNGSSTINTDAWTRPNAYFPISKCYNDFSPHNIIFDITLCGDFAGNTYNISGCNLQYPACSYQVGYNGSSFNQSYWEVESLRLFTQGGSTANAANSPQAGQIQWDKASAQASSGNSSSSSGSSTSSGQQPTYGAAASLLGSSSIIAAVGAVVASIAFVTAL